MPSFRAILAMLLFVSATWGCAFAGDDERPDRLVVYFDADNYRVANALTRIRGELTSLGVTARHRVTVRHVAVDMWSASDIEAKMRQVLARQPAVLIASNSQIA